MLSSPLSQAVLIAHYPAHSLAGGKILNNDTRITPG
jgi:hypothetical protein